MQTLFTDNVNTHTGSSDDNTENESGPHEKTSLHKNVPELKLDLTKTGVQVHKHTHTHTYVCAHKTKLQPNPSLTHHHINH